MEVIAAVELADGEEERNIELPCQRIGISRRTLQCACEEELGSRPAACIRALRLSRGGANVTDAATGSGFWHFRRVAKDDAGLFGERPPETMRGLAGRRGGSPAGPVPPAFPMSGKGRERGAPRRGCCAATKSAFAVAAPESNGFFRLRFTMSTRMR
ncbi:helix-turn-helix domain-containing protein [Poseidonocella sp. HB161398]|uniref:helix-turn-helix domain-containing protein n=1 Tax=Poseidonocella sp. HB161398 TaxID=2320855 RepID=UPI00197F7DD2|nr:helix-turn-helix domain-containing protein [Poseidonocella sp. HB161398]